MFRIETIGEDEGTVTLTLEGRITAQWVAVLEDACARVLHGPKRLILDFAGVTFIDHIGVAALKKIRGERVRCVNCCPFIEDVLGRTRKT